jgi:hypothetical protein
LELSPPLVARTKILTYKNVKYGLILAAILWLILIVASIEIADSFDKGIFDPSLSTGFAYADNWIKYFYAISQAEIGPFDLISIRYFGVYITIFLASMGAIGGIFQLWEKLNPLSHAKFTSERRRSVLLVAASICSSVIVGTSTILSSVRKDYILRNFYLLEVNLVRFEGLMFGSFSISANKDLIDTFMIYLVGYAARITAITNDIARAYDFSGEDDFTTMVDQFKASVKELQEKGLSVTEQVDDMILGQVTVSKPLYDLLTELESLQEIVRRNIRGLEK